MHTLGTILERRSNSSYINFKKHGSAGGLILSRRRRRRRRRGCRARRRSRSHWRLRRVILSNLLLGIMCVRRQLT